MCTSAPGRSATAAAVAGRTDSADFRLLSHLKGVVDLDSQVANGTIMAASNRAFT